MVSLTSKVHRLYIIIAVLFALCLTTITITLYFVYFKEQNNVSKECIIVHQQHQIHSPPMRQQERDIKVLNDPLCKP